ncbi:MAG: FKBP-type peptidyl-prolyl cis-trans isomerase [Rikenellaceae bacterium]
MKKTILTAAMAVAALCVVSCAGEQASENSNITEGKASKLDSLSYAIGANVAYGVSSHMGDIPFNYNTIAEGVTGGAFENGTIDHDAAIVILQDYFMTKRQERGMAIETARNEADSIAIVGGADPNEVAAARAALKADADMFISEEERTEVSYALGIDLGTNLRNADMPLQTYWVNKAISDVISGTPILDNEAAVAYLNNYFYVVRPAEIAKASADELAKIAKQSGVITTESGLMYRIEKAGDLSAMATDDRDLVKVLYTGKLLRSGDIFDTNRFADRDPAQKEMILAQDPTAADSDEPIEFPLNRVIPGWTEGMKLVGKGGRISLWIPSELAYGEQGVGQAIGGNEALYFDVELVDVTPYTEE